MIHSTVTVVRRRVPSRCAAAWCAVAFVGGAAVAAEPAVRRPAVPAARSRTVVDHAVVPAGGIHCRHCGPASGPLHHGHVAECRDGVCAPHCPVRPSQYGYYKTQWRRWPGQDVVPVSAEEAATPAAPPKAQVPTADEESPQAPADEALLPEAGAEADASSTPPAADRDAPAEPPRNDALETEPIPEQPGADAPRPPTRDVPQSERPTPPEPPAADELFDTSALPPPDAFVPAGPARMRVPAAVGLSLATGAEPWRLEPARRQRPAGSARGL